MKYQGKSNRGIWRAVLFGSLSGRNPLLSREWAWHAVVSRSFLTVILLSAPLCYFLGYYEVNSPFTILPIYEHMYAYPSWPVALAEAYLYTCGPYLLWVPLVFAMHWLGFRSRGTKYSVPPARRLWCAAMGFPFAYWCLWSLPNSLKYILVYLRWVVFLEVKHPKFLFWWYLAIMCISAGSGLALLFLGIWNNTLRRRNSDGDHCLCQASKNGDLGTLDVATDSSAD